MKLYGDLISPFVRMSMVTALECGLSGRVELRNTLVKPHQVNEELAKLSPIAKVPVLETDHGTAIYDSRVIMEYFCHVCGNKQLLPDEGHKHFHVLTLLALAQGFGDTCVTYRYEDFARAKELQWGDYKARLKTRMESCIVELEARWLPDLGEVSLGSIAAACVLSYVDARGLLSDWGMQHAAISEWHTKFKQRDSMRNTEPKV